MFYREDRGLWVERITDSSGKVHEISAKTKADLKRKMFDHQEKIDNGPTFEAMADAWESFSEKHTEDTTALSYHAHVERAKNFFSGMYIKDITPDRVQAYLDYLAGQNYAKDTVRRSKGVLSRICKYAIVQPGSKMMFNPCTACDVPKGLKKTRREPPSENQLQKIKPDSEMGLFAFFIFYSGLRDGELLGLRWDDIDREAMVIHVRRVATYHDNKAVVKERAKTASGVRDVPLIDILADALPQDQTGYVFGGSAPLTHTAFRKRWISFCRDIGEVREEVYIHKGKNGHEYKRTKYIPLMTPYQFRHEYASLLEEAGVSEFDAKTAMGHSSIVVTKDVYTHIRERKHQSETAKKLNELVRGVKVD